jgi:hypothetical protein
VSRVGLCLQKRPQTAPLTITTFYNNGSRPQANEKVRTALTLFTAKPHNDKAKWRRARDFSVKDAPLLKCTVDGKDHSSRCLFSTVSISVRLHRVFLARLPQPKEFEWVECHFLTHASTIVAHKGIKCFIQDGPGKVNQL